MAAANPNKFPYDSAKPRLTRYNFNKQLFSGDHFSAFNIKVDNKDYNKTYAQLRYVVNNFAGLLSKVSADFLFSEAPSIKLPVIDKANPYTSGDGDGINEGKDASADSVVYETATPKANPNQEWLENLLFDNRMEVQLYESALTNSYKGDAVFKLRVGELHEPGKSSIIIEQVMPDYYFPDLDNHNVSAEPKRVELAFAVDIASKKYLFKEVHEPGTITNELYEMDGEKIVRQVDLSLYDADLQPVEETGIDRILVVHIPNWSDGTTHFGIDDYQDLVTLLYALNNRVTLVDNILDKHADPILAVPEGVLDEDGNVDRKHLGVYEKGQDKDKPEYIVWDAKLDSSFKEIDHLLDSLYMYSETSPSVFGQQSGNNGRGSESGRALKYRLMRTVAKIKRKQRYYDFAIREIVYLAELLAIAHNVPALGVSFKGEAEVPSIEWPDPVPVDSYEQAQEEELRLASGNQSLRDSIKNIDKLDDEQAIQKVQEIYAEQKQLAPAVSVPTSGAPSSSNKFGKDIIDPKTGRPPQAA